MSICLFCNRSMRQVDLRRYHLKCYEDAHNLIFSEMKQFCSCGNPLPLPKRPTGRQQEALARRTRKKYTPKAHNPMHYLGMDYVEAKLKGWIKTPQGPGRQIALKV